MQTVSNAPVLTQRTSWPVVLAGYLLLALTYHAAEYAMRFHQHVLLFLGGMLAVVLVAYAVAKWQGFNGLPAWGLRWNKRFALLLLLGVGLGLLVNGLALQVRLWLGMEYITAVPNVTELVTQTLFFAIGTFLPSLAEDILTRGYLFRHFGARMSRWGFVLFSSAVYVLNHLYALDDGPTMLVYLFVLGVMLAIPLVYTKSLWYTVGLHWAGNIVYRFSNDVITVQEETTAFSALWELTLFLALLAAVNYGVSRKLSESL